MKQINLNSYSDFLKIKRYILLRDNYRCVICKCYREKLHIHHLDKNRNNNKEFNLYTLCAKCHSYIHGRSTNPWWL